MSKFYLIDILSLKLKDTASFTKLSLEISKSRFEFMLFNNFNFFGNLFLFRKKKIRLRICLSNHN